jgi:origin recognition complex subunit 2
MVNGYAHTTNLREILSVVASAIDPTQRVPNAQPAVMIQSITSLLSSTKLTITIIVNSIDAIPLRKPGSQAILSQLAAHPQINLVGSADSPDFPLLWDIGVRSDFNFVFHDCTTFSPFKAELDVVDDVHELLGRQSQRVNGREGVAFVLKSLTENAKNLFRLLVGEVLIAMEDEGDDGVGLEYRMVYNKAVEEFICSSEMAFRTLLKE